MAGYGTDDGFGAWQLANGYTAGASGLTPAVLRQRGSNYVDGVYGAKFPGVPTGGLDQERAWPRTGACVFGADIGSGAIPAVVVNASYHAAVQEDLSPGSLALLVSAVGQVTSEQVGPIKVTYAEPKGDVVAASTPLLTAVEGLLAPLITNLVPAIYAV